MSRIDFTKKLETYKKYRNTYETKKLRYYKLIAETIKLIIKNNSKNLSNNDIKILALKIYKKYDRKIHTGIRGMLNQDIAKKTINDELQRILTDNGIKPLLKVVEHSQKASEAAKNTSDHIQVAKFFREIAEIEPQTTAKQTETINYNEYMQPVSKQVKREISTTTQITPDDIVSQKDIDDSVSQQNGENSEKTHS